MAVNCITTFFKCIFLIMFKLALFFYFIRVVNCPVPARPRAIITVFLGTASVEWTTGRCRYYLSLNVVN